MTFISDNSVIYVVYVLYMVPTAKEILFSRTKLPFPGQSIQDLKIIKIWAKMHIIFIQCMIKGIVNLHFKFSGLI